MRIFPEMCARTLCPLASSTRQSPRQKPGLLHKIPRSRAWEQGDHAPGTEYGSGMPGRHDHRQHRGLLLDFGGVLTGTRKPDPAIYSLAAERLGVSCQACVFVDDLPMNLEPARALGMTVIHKTSAGQVISDLERVLQIPLR